MTPIMEADMLAQAFNGTAERSYWVARVGGSPRMPTVKFTSRSAMIELVYHIETKRFSVVFRKTQCAFGDFLGGIHRALTQVHQGMKAAGLPVVAPLDENDGNVRIEYDFTTKEAYVKLTNLSDAWVSAVPEFTTSNFPVDTPVRTL
jgi:hypothetical protein